MQVSWMTGIIVVQRLRDTFENVRVGWQWVYTKVGMTQNPAVEKNNSPRAGITIRPTMATAPTDAVGHGGVRDDSSLPGTMQSTVSAGSSAGVASDRVRTKKSAASAVKSRKAGGGADAERGSGEKNRPSESRAVAKRAAKKKRAHGRRKAASLQTAAGSSGDQVREPLGGSVMSSKDKSVEGGAAVTKAATPTPAGSDKPFRPHSERSVAIALANNRLLTPEEASGKAKKLATQREARGVASRRQLAVQEDFCTRPGW
jgi:hypothetical protein